MTGRVVKVVLVLLMLVGIVLSMFNFVAEKVEAAAIWQHLETGTDPVLGTPYIKCFDTGQACVTVTPYDGQ